MLTLLGTPYERGEFLGSKLRNQIVKTLYDEREALFEWVKERNLSPPTEEELSGIFRQGLSYSVAFAPDLIEELRGVSSASGVDFMDLLLFNYFLDISDIEHKQHNSSLLKRVGCTCFAVSGEKTDDKHVYIGQNYDWSALQSGTVLTKITALPPSILCFTVAGLVGCAGMNSNGLGIVINKLTPDDSTIRVPYTFVLRKALEQDSLAKAIDIILTAPRSSGISYTLCNKWGDIICVETTANSSEILLTSKNYFVHTNHYQHPHLLSHDASFIEARQGSSYVRLNRMNRYFQNNKISLSDLQQTCRDLVGYPDSICCPSTVASLIMDLTENKLWFCNGRPDQNPYKEYSFL